MRVLRTKARVQERRDGERVEVTFAGRDEPPD
jgi:hypothetical protein